MRITLIFVLQPVASAIISILRRSFAKVRDRRTIFQKNLIISNYLITEFHGNFSISLEEWGNLGQPLQKIIANIYYDTIPELITSSLRISSIKTHSGDLLKYFPVQKYSEISVQNLRINSTKNKRNFQ